MKKYKVFNNNNFNVGIRFENTGHEVTIRPKTFAMMTDEDILYINSVSKLFEKGIIYVEDQEMLERMGYTEKNPNTITEDEIKEILRLSNSRMKSQLRQITEKHAINKVIKVAKDTDLPHSKIKIIGDIFDVNIFEELEEELI